MVQSVDELERMLTGQVPSASPMGPLLNASDGPLLDNIQVKEQVVRPGTLNRHPFSFSQPASAATSLAPSASLLKAHPLLEECLAMVIDFVKENVYTEHYEGEAAVPDRGGFIREHPEYAPMLRAIEAIAAARAMNELKNMQRTSDPSIKRLYMRIALNAYLDVSAAHRKKIQDRGEAPGEGMYSTSL